MQYIEHRFYTSCQHETNLKLEQLATKEIFIRKCSKILKISIEGKEIYNEINWTSTIRLEGTN